MGKPYVVRSPEKFWKTYVDSSDNCFFHHQWVKKQLSIEIKVIIPSSFDVELINSWPACSSQVN